MRLKAALKLYTSSAPQIAEECEPSAQAKYQVNNLFPVKRDNFFTDEIINQYQEILLNGQSALGSHTLNAEIRWRLAELFDKIVIQISEIYELTQELDNIDILIAVS